MLFTSITFLFIFLPIIMIGFLLINLFSNDNRIKNIFIFIASLIFYSFGNIYHVLLLISIIILDYILGIFIKKNCNRNSSKTYLILGIILNLLILSFYKYTNFFIDNANIILDNLNVSFSLSTIKLSLPIGLSFYIFQSISYLIDIYREKALPQKNIIGIGLYISFFANITSGPIIRYENFEKQLLNRTIHISDTYKYIERFILGLSKKVILAIPLGIYADKIFTVPASNNSTLVSWFGIILYTLQIYIDFSSYSDMAISLAGIFGFHINENFNYPYTATSIQDFWRKWHISLSTWFKEYLYIPLGGNRHGNLITCRNTIIVFTLCGFWHGASWTYIIWGLYYGLILSFERIFFKKILDKLYKPFRHAYTLLVVMIGWVFFRSDSLSYATSFIGSMLGLNNRNATVLLSDIVNLEIIVVLLFSLLILTPLLNTLFNKININKSYTLILRYSLVLLTLFICFVWLSPTIKGSLEVPFIYTKF